MRKYKITRACNQLKNLQKINSRKSIAKDHDISFSSLFLICNFEFQLICKLIILSQVSHSILLLCKFQYSIFMFICFFHFSFYDFSSLLYLNGFIFTRFIIIYMKAVLICILAVLALAHAQQFKLHAIRSHPPGRAHLSHSQVVLDEYHTKRHDLNEYLRHQDGNFEEAALDTNHYGFLLPLKVAGISYNVSMDTGSADFFIKGQDATGLPQKKYKSGVNYKKKKQFPIAYLDGRLKTYENNLQVQFKNHKFNCPLLVAYTSNVQFDDVQGLIGLSFPELATHRPTFIETLIQNKIISTYAYGMNLNLIQDGRSFVTFGDKDPDLYQGQLHEFDISQSKEIKIDFQNVQVGNSKKMPIPKALLDTGNTCISIPRQFQQTILKQFNKKGNKCAFLIEQSVPMFSLLICRVTNFDVLPTIKLSIEGNIYEIQKQFYFQKCAQNPEQANNVHYCETYIQSVNYRAKQIFLGDGFFNRFYTFFDLENLKVGIAKNKENITMDDILSQSYYFDRQDWEGLIPEEATY